MRERLQLIANVDPPKTPGGRQEDIDSRLHVPRPSDEALAGAWSHWWPRTTEDTAAIFRSARQHGGGAAYRIRELLALGHFDPTLWGIRGMQAIEQSWNKDIANEIDEANERAIENLVRPTARRD